MRLWRDILMVGDSLLESTRDCSWEGRCYLLSMKWELGWCRAAALAKSRAGGRAQFFTPFLAWLYFHSSPKVMLNFLLRGWRSRRRMCGKGTNVWSGWMGWEGCNERVRPAAVSHVYYYFCIFDPFLLCFILVWPVFISFWIVCKYFGTEIVFPSAPPNIMGTEPKGFWECATVLVTPRCSERKPGFFERLKKDTHKKSSKRAHKIKS